MRKTSYLGQFSDYQMSFKAASKCFYYNFFRIELSCEWVDAKNLKLFHGMLLHSSVAMETHFAQLRSYLENRNNYAFKFDLI